MTDNILSKMDTNWNQIFFKFIKKHNNKPWNWNGLSYNIFTKGKEIFELRVKHQKFVQDRFFEEFVKVYMHPKRIQKLLDMGYEIDELDEVL